MIKQFIFNSLNSWFSSGVGVIWGGPKIWEGMKGLFDADPVTAIDWKIALPGLGILAAFLMVRDFTKGWLKSDRFAPPVK